MNDIGSQVPHPSSSDPTAYTTPPPKAPKAKEPSGIPTPAPMREQKTGEPHDVTVVKSGGVTQPGGKAPIDAPKPDNNPGISNTACKVLQDSNQQPAPPAPITENRTLAQLPNIDAIDAHIAGLGTVPLDLTAIPTMEEAEVSTTLNLDPVDINSFFAFNEASDGIIAAAEKKTFHGVATTSIDARGKGSPKVDKFHKDPHHCQFSFTDEGKEYKAMFSPDAKGLILNADAPTQVLQKFIALANAHNSAHGLPPLKHLSIILVDNETWSSFEQSLLALSTSQQHKVDDKEKHKSEESKVITSQLPIQSMSPSRKKDRTEDKKKVEEDLSAERKKESINTSIKKSDELADAKATEKRHKIQERYVKETKDERREKSENIKADQKNWEERKK